MGQCTIILSAVKGPMTPYQLRMARACLNLTVRELELRTGVNKNTVSRYEAAQEVLASAVLKLEAYFRQEGLIFLNEDDARGRGVLLSKELSRRLTQHLEPKAKSSPRKPRT